MKSYTSQTSGSSYRQTISYTDMLQSHIEQVLLPISDFGLNHAVA